MRLNISELAAHGSATAAAAALPGPASPGYNAGSVQFNPSRRVLLLAVITASLVLPGIAHLRLGAAVSGLAFLVVTAALGVVQFGAPFFEPTAQAALYSGIAFVLGWPVSLMAARSAARLVHADS
jgi:hypothetical protein